jgi:hypothetical protein
MSTAKDNTGLSAFVSAMSDVANHTGKTTGLELNVIVAIHNMGSFINIDEMINGAKTSTGKTITANAMCVKFLRDNDPSYVKLVAGKNTGRPTTADSGKLAAWEEAKEECKRKCLAMEKMMRRAMPVASFLRSIDANTVSVENKGKTLVYTGKNMATDTLKPVDGDMVTTHATLANVQRVATAFNAAKARGFTAPVKVTTTTTTANKGGTQETRSTIDGAGIIAKELDDATGETRKNIMASPSLDAMLIAALKVKFATKDTLDLVAFSTWLATTMKTQLHGLTVIGSIVAPVAEKKPIAAAATVTGNERTGKKAA